MELFSWDSRLRAKSYKECIATFTRGYNVMMCILFDTARYALLNIGLVSLQKILYLFVETLIPKFTKHLEALLSCLCLQIVW